MKKTNLKNNKNTINDSSLSTGRDAHIGDQYNISIDAGKFVLIAMILSALCFMVFKMYQVEDPNYREATTTEITTEDSLIQDEDKAIPNPTEIQGEKISKKTSQKVPVQEDNTVSVGIKLIDTEELLESHVNLLLAKAFERKGVVSAKVKNSKNFDKILECQVKLYQEEVELGIQSHKKISFTLSGKIYDSASGKILSSVNEQSLDYHILIDSDLVTCLKQWLSSINLDV